MAWSDLGYTACPHCGREFRNNCYATHEPICLDNPVIAERLSIALECQHYPGTIITTAQYRRMSKRCHDLPSFRVVMNRYGSWTAVAETFGLHCDGYTRGPNSSYKYIPSAIR